MYTSRGRTKINYNIKLGKSFAPLGLLGKLYQPRRLSVSILTINHASNKPTFNVIYAFCIIVCYRDFRENSWGVPARYSF